MAVPAVVVTVVAAVVGRVAAAVLAAFDAPEPRSGVREALVDAGVLRGAVLAPGRAAPFARVRAAPLRAAPFAAAPFGAALFDAVLFDAALFAAAPFDAAPLDGPPFGAAFLDAARFALPLALLDLAIALPWTRVRVDVARTGGRRQTCVRARRRTGSNQPAGGAMRLGAQESCLAWQQRADCWFAV